MCYVLPWSTLQTNDTDERIQVLHVDDEPHFADKVSMFVERADDSLSVETATSVDEALELVEETAFDCVISGYDMEGRDGIDFLEAVRDRHPELPFILYTGEGSEMVASEAISNGVSDYVQKRSDSDQYLLLANLVQNLVSRRRAQQKIERNAERRKRLGSYHQDVLDLTTDPDVDSETQMVRLLGLTCEYFGTGNGFLVKINEEIDRHRVISTVGTDLIQTGISDLSETYCRKTLESDDILEVYNASEQSRLGDPAYEKWGFGCCIGKKLIVEGELYGTVCFASDEPREEPFTPEDRTFFDLVGSTLNQLLERERRQHQLEALFEHAQDATLVVDVVEGDSFTVRRVNPAFERLTGVAADDIDGSSLTAGLGEDAGTELRTRFLDCVDRREVIESEDLCPLPEPETEWRTKFAPIVESDEVVQIVGTMRPRSDLGRSEGRDAKQPQQN